MPNKKFIIFAIIFLAIIIVMAGFLFVFVINKQPKSYSQVLENIGIVKEKNYVRIMFAGDLMFDRGIRYYANKNGGNNYIFEKISSLLKENDLNIVNLEGPITDNKSVSSGTIPGSPNNYYFTFDSSVAKTLFDQNIKIVSLGNNHITNFGRAGVASTKNYLDQANVDYFGAPDSPKSISTEIKGVKMTFINYNEFASSDLEAEQKFVLEEIGKATLRRAQGKNNIIIIFCHWGVEYAKTPRDTDVDLAHQFIDAGADLVIGSHPHVKQTIETYKNKRIYYSLGNFIFDQYFNEDVRNGMGVVVKIDPETLGHSPTGEAKELSFEEKNFYLQSGGQTIIK